MSLKMHTVYVGCSYGLDVLDARRGTLNELVMFTGVLWLIHQLVSIGSAFFFKSLHEKDRFPKLRAQKGKEPADKLVESAWKEWLLNHTVSVPFSWHSYFIPLFVWRGGTVSVVHT